jgi:hypothetical protein
MKEVENGFEDWLELEGDLYISCRNERYTNFSNLFGILETCQLTRVVGLSWTFGLLVL